MTAQTTARPKASPAGAKRGPAAGGHGSRIIEALESAWQAIRDNHPEVPPAVMITGSGHGPGTPRGYTTLGHHAADRWTVDQAKGTRAPELFIAGEILASGDAGRLVVETLLHEAAHAVAHARKVKDASASGNRYHNKRFATIAAELGLCPPAAPAKITGFSECTLTSATAARYAAVIEAISTASLPYLPAAGIGAGTAGPGEEGEEETGEAEGEPKRGGKRQAAECACNPPRRLQVSPKQLETGPIICGNCEAEFAVPADHDGDDGEHEAAGE
jgi:hypothetical protein